MAFQCKLSGITIIPEKQDKTVFMKIPVGREFASMVENDKEYSDHFLLHPKDQVRYLKF